MPKGQSLDLPSAYAQPESTLAGDRPPHSYRQTMYDIFPHTLSTTRIRFTPLRPNEFSAP